MKTYTRQFEITGMIQLRATDDEDAQQRMRNLSIAEIARMFGNLDYLAFPLIEVQEHGGYRIVEEPEGLSRLKASELVRF